MPHIYQQIQEEYGSVKKVVLQDTTELRRNQMPINANFRIIDADIYF